MKAREAASLAASFTELGGYVAYWHSALSSTAASTSAVGGSSSRPNTLDRDLLAERCGEASVQGAGRGVGLLPDAQPIQRFSHILK